MVFAGVVARAAPAGAACTDEDVAAADDDNDDDDVANGPVVVEVDEPVGLMRASKLTSWIGPAMVACL